MTYTKPQITIIGSASDVIESCGGKSSCAVDGTFSPSSAYDLDE